MTGAANVKVVVDRSRCVGHGLCHEFAAEVFDLDDVGYCLIPVEEIGEELVQKARTGASRCPEGAITINEKGR